METTAIWHIQNNLDVLKILNHYGFEKINASGKYYRACCKIHGGDSPTSFVINSENGLWYCHTTCDCGGDVFTLAEKIENINFPQAVKAIASILGIDIDGMEIGVRTNDLIKETKNVLDIIKNNKAKELQEYVINADIKKVNGYKGFREETLKYFDVGFIEEMEVPKSNKEGTYKITKSLVFPIIMNGVQIGASFRATKSDAFAKWIHQPTNINTSEILFNYDNAKSSNIIVICEGITDVMAYHEIGVSAVACFGSHMTLQQVELLRNTCAVIVLSFYGDNA